MVTYLCPSCGGDLDKPPASESCVFKIHGGQIPTQAAPTVDARYAQGWNDAIEAAATCADETPGEYADVPTVCEYESWHAAKIRNAIRALKPKESTDATP